MSGGSTPLMAPRARARGVRGGPHPRAGSRPRRPSGPDRPGVAAATLVLAVAVAGVLAGVLALPSPARALEQQAQDVPQSAPQGARVAEVGETVELEGGHTVTVHGVERHVTGTLAMMGAEEEQTAAVLDVEICAGTEALPASLPQGGNFGLWLPRGQAAEVHHGHSGSGITWNGASTFALPEPWTPLAAGTCVRGPIPVGEPPRNGAPAVTFDTRAYQDELPPGLGVHLAWTLPVS